MEDDIVRVLLITVVVLIALGILLIRKRQKSKGKKQTGLVKSIGLGIAVFFGFSVSLGGILTVMDKDGNKQASASPAKEEKKTFAFEVIYVIDGPNMNFVQTNEVNKESTVAITKELKKKYGESLGVIHFFDKSQSVIKGVKPNLMQVDPKATFLPGDSEIHFFDQDERVSIEDF